LFEKLIAFIREFGHSPVRNELRRKCREDPTFPNEKVFSRFASGLGPTLTAKVRAFCEIRPGLKDLLSILAGTPLPNDISSDKSGSEDPNFGYVYLLKSGRYYKMGEATRQIEESMNSQSNCPRGQGWFIKPD